MTDPVIKKAIAMRDGLVAAAREFRRIGKRSDHAATKELMEMDAVNCENAAEMLEKLGTEVDRLRLGIGIRHYGRLSGAKLMAMTKNWNGDA